MKRNCLVLKEGDGKRENYKPWKFKLKQDNAKNSFSFHFTFLLLSIQHGRQASSVMLIHLLHMLKKNWNCFRMAGSRIVWDPKNTTFAGWGGLFSTTMMKWILNFSPRRFFKSEVKVMKHFFFSKEPWQATKELKKNSQISINCIHRMCIRLCRGERTINNSVRTGEKKVRIWQPRGWKKMS